VIAASSAVGTPPTLTIGGGPSPTWSDAMIVPSADLTVSISNETIPGREFIGRRSARRAGGYARAVSGQRALPEQASLRHLKLEAKRRLAAGEFPTLHAAQLAVAREHGQPSWSALKSAVEESGPAGGRAVTQLRWIVGRFRDAAEDGWTAPDAAELREHFTEQFLAHVPPDRLIEMFTAVPSELREELEVTATTPFIAQCRIAGRLVVGVTETSAPYRLSGLQLRRLGERVTDPRTASPGTAAEGAAPDAVAGIAADAIARLGLPGISLAGRARGGPGWAAPISSGRSRCGRVTSSPPTRSPRSLPRSPCSGWSPAAASRSTSGPAVISGPSG
jgi:hypothetical protein